MRSCKDHRRHHSCHCSGAEKEGNGRVFILVSRRAQDGVNEQLQRLIFAILIIHLSGPSCMHNKSGDYIAGIADECMRVLRQCVVNLCHLPSDQHAQSTHPPALKGCAYVYTCTSCCARLVLPVSCTRAYTSAGSSSGTHIQ